MKKIFEENVEAAFYFPVCNESEIERILNVRNSEDYLLKLRADTIVDNMRLFRVYRNKALMNEKNWSLEKSFSTDHYNKFIQFAKPEIKEKCKNILAGNVFSTDPNGQIFSTEHGRMITICDSLNFFFKFMNLGLMDFGDIVPEHVAINAMRIAIRVMFQTEALDFFMDPRGILPYDVGVEIHKSIPYQMQFISGHEYAHYILGHLDNNKLFNKPIFRAIFPSQTDYGSEKAYEYSHKNEFEADENSILLCNYNSKEKTLIFESALVWFAGLELIEGIVDSINPPTGIPTHPPARERFENLLHKIKMPKKYDYGKWRDTLDVVEYYKEFFIEDVSMNLDVYETYGSCYLDKPDSKWRGRELKDRVDYY